jgi:DNA-binding NtrC family response regulator
MTAKSLLLVDDEPALLGLLKTFLERHGHRVRACDNPAAALELVEAEPLAFDLVVSDLTLAGMTGEEMIERMQAASPQLRAVIASGYPYQPRLAGVEFLQKPFLPKMLLELMERVFATPQNASVAKTGKAAR